MESGSAYWLIFSPALAAIVAHLVAYGQDAAYRVGWKLFYVNLACCFASAFIFGTYLRPAAIVRMVCGIPFLYTIK
ncbi:hypothetical protein PG997_010706 [Apiospora hydei]|uniref:Uncharacterized protein n=1 Tax=Apiospora hydei TaxID=1337664 RepID=A0ABR1VKW4_9PEZI